MHAFGNRDGRIDQPKSNKEIPLQSANRVDVISIFLKPERTKEIYKTTYLSVKPTSIIFTPRYSKPQAYKIGSAEKDKNY